MTRPGTSSSAEVSIVLAVSLNHHLDSPRVKYDFHAEFGAVWEHVAGWGAFAVEWDADAA